MKTLSKKRFKLMCLTLMVLLLLTGCALLPTTISDLATGMDDTVTISRAEYERLQRYAELDEIWQIVEQYYYQEPDTQAMLDGAEMGLLYGLGDPYTYYYTPDQYAQLWADDEGEYAGIGIQIMGNYATGLCTISRVFLDSPALDAGLRKGDILPCGGYRRGHHHPAGRRQHHARRTRHPRQRAGAARRPAAGLRGRPCRGACQLGQQLHAGWGRRLHFAL